MSRSGGSGISGAYLCNGEMALTATVPPGTTVQVRLTGRLPSSGPAPIPLGPPQGNYPHAREALFQAQL
ncbi:hypothetical protein FCN77_01365 [Arthrobacter sp. 24S4-2]|uniref:hypothetical protein n=1 Tax=Arthrobacter sp. 24S4-2 TaxID=2575374 RepID=UPI0010C7A6F2|nr:hypothetical protein [Arthrobacter sp. 24S4-2]QCO96608.1 hypothetical protein FCN77_01365 [Arthrobacter sp. 24S4-2]